MTEKKKVAWWNKGGSFAEIYQQTGFLFAFVSSPKTGGKMCHNWVKCRDFLPDAARTQITGQACNIYSFGFNTATNPPIDLKRMRMLVTKGDMKNQEEEKSFAEMASAAVKLLNFYERKTKIPLSKVYEVDTKSYKYKKVFMFIGSSVWMSSPFLISMYTFLIRLGHKKLSFTNGVELSAKFEELVKEVKAGKMRDNDAQYLITSWDKIETILRNRDLLFTKKDGFHDIYTRGLGISDFHNRTGLVALANKSTPDQGLNKRAKEVFEK